MSAALLWVLARGTLCRPRAGGRWDSNPLPFARNPAFLRLLHPRSRPICTPLLLPLHRLHRRQRLLQRLWPHRHGAVIPAPSLPSRKVVKVSGVTRLGPERQGGPPSKPSGKVPQTHSVGPICDDDFGVFTVTNVASLAAAAHHVVDLDRFTIGFGDLAAHHHTGWGGLFGGHLELLSVVAVESLSGKGCRGPERRKSAVRGRDTHY
jgi:hypothetical protein